MSEGDRRLIEDYLPLETLNAIAAKEKNLMKKTVKPSTQVRANKRKAKLKAKRRHQWARATG